MAISQAYKDRLRGFEVPVNHMYLDSNGYVTIGVGHMLPDANAAVALPFRKYRVAGEEPPISSLSPGTLKLGNLRPFGDLASLLPTPSLGIRVDFAVANQIRDEFNTIKAKPKGYIYTWYRKFTNIWLTDNDVDALFEADLVKYWEGLVGVFPAIATFPQGAQDALFDLHYNAGLGKQESWPNLKSSVNQRDWTKAATQCHRAPPVPADRNDFARQCFLDAAEEESRRNRRAVDENDYQSFGNRIHATPPRTP